MRRVLVALLVGLAAFAAMGATAPGAEPPLRPIASGVTVSGVPVGGLSAVHARQRLRSEFEQRLNVHVGTRHWSVSPHRFHARAAVADGVQRALQAKPFERVYVPVGVAVPAVRDWVDWLAKQVYVAPTDARLVGEVNLRPAVAGGTPGRELDKAATLRRIRWDLRHGQRTPLRLAMKPVQPRVGKDDLGPVVVISRAENRLILYHGAKEIREFAVATGQSIYPTPAGDWHIVVKQRDPWWYPPNDPWAAGAKPVPPGPGNPLGTRWMGLDVSGVGIHGTPEDASIGYSESHGCIRMHIPDAEWLFEHVLVGTPVYIV